MIAAHDLYCCLLPQCEALRTCRSGFPIATVQCRCLPLLRSVVCCNQLWDFFVNSSFRVPVVLDVFVSFSEICVSIRTSRRVGRLWPFCIHKSSEQVQGAECLCRHWQLNTFCYKLQPIKWCSELSTPHQSWLSWFDSRPGHTEDVKNGTCRLPSLVLGVDGWVRRERRFTRGAATDLPLVQHSLWK